MLDLDFFFLNVEGGLRRSLYMVFLPRGQGCLREATSWDTAVDENCISEDAAAASPGDHPWNTNCELVPRYPRLHVALGNIFRSNENVFDRKGYQMRKEKNQRCANTLGWAEWPQRCPGPNAWNCEHMTLHDRRDSADGIKVRKTVLDYPNWPSLTTGAFKVENFLQPEEEIREMKQKENKNTGRFKGERTRPAAARAGHTESIREAGGLWEQRPAPS